MRFVISTIGTLGDALPFIHVAAELRRRGHETTLLVNSAFQSLVENHGVAFESLGTPEQYYRLAHSEDFYHPMRGVKEISRQWILPSIEKILQYFRRAPATDDTVLIGSPVSVGLRIAQEIYGLPLHTLILSPFFLPSVHVAPVSPGITLPAWAPRPVKRMMQTAADRLLDGLLKPDINRIRSEQNLAPLRSSVRSWWFSPDSVIGLFPSWFAPVQPDWPDALTLTNFLPPPPSDDLQPDLQRFLSEGGPLIVATMGSVAAGNQDLLRAIGKASADGHFRCLFLTPAQNVIDPASAQGQAMQVPFAPLASVLPKAQLIIHHAGIGTASAALWAGVPQLLIPYGHDQFDNAARLERLGVAKVLSAKTRLNPARLVAEFNRMLSDTKVSAACVEARTLFRASPNIDDICKLLATKRAVLSQTPELDAARRAPGTAPPQ